MQFKLKNKYIYLFLSFVGLIFFINSGFKKINSISIFGDSFSLTQNVENDLISPTESFRYCAKNIFNYSDLTLSYNQINEIFQKTIDVIGNGIKPQGTPYIISYYCKGSPNGFIDNTNINGISFWMYNGKNLNHYFYENQNGNFVSLKNLEVTIDYFSFYLCDVLHFYSFKNESSPDNSTCYTFRGNMDKKTRIYTGINDGGLLKNIINDNSENNAYKILGQKSPALVKYSDEVIDFIEPGGKKCKKNECEKGDGECRDLTPGDDDYHLSCYDYTTESCRIATLAEKAKTFGVFDSKVFDFKKYYKFRDDFLSKSELGKKYIKNYYIISYFSTLIDFNLKEINEHLNFLSKVNNFIDDIMSEGDYDKIIIDDSFFKEALDLINIYKSKSNDQNYQQSLNDLISDLTKFKGKTKENILKEI